MRRAKVMWDEKGRAWLVRLRPARVRGSRRRVVDHVEAVYVEEELQEGSNYEAGRDAL